MEDEDLEELGPVDYLVVEFPGSKFNGDIAPTLIDLVDRGIVRVLDLIIITKESDGSFDAIELDDFEDGATRTFRVCSASHGWRIRCEWSHPGAGPDRFV